MSNKPTLEDMRKIEAMRDLDYTWSEIADEIPNYSDNYRKYFVGYLTNKDVEETNSISKQAKKSLLLKQKQKEISLQRSVLNEQIRDIALHKSITDQVVEAIRDINPVKITNTSLPFDELDSDKAYVFTIADLHYNGDYSLLEQLSKAFSNIISVVQQHALKHVYLLELGDTIDGNTLRKSQFFYVKSGMVKQVVDISQHYVNCLRELMSVTNVTFISVDSSNHTQLRNLGTKQNELVEEDLMIVFNNYIETALPNLDFIHGVDVLFNVFNFNVFVSHGHLVRNKEKYLESLQSDRGLLIDYGFFGHYHHQRTIDLHANGNYDKKVFYVPTLNSNEGNYERDKNLSSQPGIGMYVFDNVYGNTEVHKIIIK